jgi:hypothetical protein
MPLSLSPPPVWLRPGDTSNVAILALYLGDKYQDTAISELIPAGCPESKVTTFSKPAMNQDVRMTTSIVILLLIIMPAASESQTINAHVGKQNIYLDSGKVRRGPGPPGGTDVYDIRFSKHGTFERLVFGIRETTDDKPSETPCGANPIILTT